MKSRLLVGFALFVVCLHLGADSKEAERLLPSYVQPGLILSTKRYHAEYLSEQEAVIAVLEQFLIWKKKDPEFKQAKFGKPIVIKDFGYHSPPPVGYDYYDCVPLLDPEVGIRGAYYCFKLYNEKTGKNFFEAGLYTPMGQKGKPVKMLYAEDVKTFIEDKFHIKLRQDPIAVRLYVRQFKTQKQDWFWYARLEDGFEYNGRKVHSLFVLPYVSLPDVGTPLTVDFLMERTSCMAIHVLITDRVYILEGEDINFYELENKRVRGEQVYTGDAREEYKYLNEIKFIPLR